ncbi:MAG: hypothetical protein CMG63_03645 [Candidatus Marinimicrobia bacterium]|nr:hypothetical protein [Candidatus Neomarinimicrobiota bacterium]
MKQSKKTLSIIFPVFENGQNLPHLYEEIVEFKKSLNNIDLELIFIDDGSTDNSFEEMEKIKKNFIGKTRLIQFTKNFGQASALNCGWKIAKGDYIGNISSDQQDPLSIFNKMLEHLIKDNSIVIAARKKRNDGLTSDFISKFFFSIVNRYVIKEYPPMGSDLMLFTKEVRDYLILRDERGNNEVALLLRSGYKYRFVYYERHKRKYGKNKTSFFRKITALIDIVFSNSYIPIRIVSIVGFFLGFFGISYGIFVIYKKFLEINSSVNLGWASTISIISIFSGFILISLGIIGEYFWRILENIKKPEWYTINKFVK